MKQAPVIYISTYMTNQMYCTAVCTPCQRVQGYKNYTHTADPFRVISWNLMFYFL